MGSLNEDQGYKFLPINDLMFATAYDNGILKFWNVDNGELIYQMQFSTKGTPFWLIPFYSNLLNTVQELYYDQVKNRALLFF